MEKSGKMLEKKNSMVRCKHGAGGTNSNGDWLSVDGQKENAPLPNQAGQGAPAAKSKGKGKS